MPEFTWVPFYEEFADKLLSFRKKPSDLLGILVEMSNRGFPMIDLYDYEGGKKKILDEIDPFTVFATFNRNISEDDRVRVAVGLGRRIGVLSDIPRDFVGTPKLVSRYARFFSQGNERKKTDFEVLWRLFDESIRGDIKDETFHDALNIQGLAIPKITIGLFWARPHEYIPLDDRTKRYLLSHGIEVSFRADKKGFSSGSSPISVYNSLIVSARNRIGKTFPEISRDASKQKFERKRNSSPYKIIGLVHKVLEKYNGSWSGTVSDLQRDLREFDKQHSISIGTIGRIIKNEKLLIENGIVVKRKRTSKSRMVMLELDDGIINDYESSVGIDDAFVEDPQDTAEKLTYRTIDFPRNLVLYGPPGTGKTWRLHHEIAPRLLLGERAGTLDEAARTRLDERMRSVTFHQAFGYEDFVEGIRPVSEQGGVRYELQPGLFRQVCELALRAAGVTEGMDAFCALERNERAARLRDAPPVLLAIDELNRGNVAAILGELVTLLEEDKRLGAEHEVIVTLPGSRERFGVPPNLWVVATMNTADRSIVALDAALRRRFAFEEVPPRPELLAGLVVEGVEVERLLRAINRRIERLLDRDHRLGHAAFLRLRGEPTLAALRSLFASYVLPQLQEHFHEDLGRVGLVLGPRFVRQEREPEPFAAGFEHELREELGERPLWRLVDPRGLGPEDFRSVYEPVEAG